MFHTNQDSHWKYFTTHQSEQMLAIIISIPQITEVK